MSEYIKAPDSSQPPRNADSSHRLDIATLAPDDAEYWQSIVNNNVLFMPAIIAPDEVEAAAPDYDCADGELSVPDQQLFSTNTRYSFGAVLGWIPREGYCSMNLLSRSERPSRSG